MRISIIYKLIFFFSAIILAIVVIITVYFYNETEKIFKNQINNDLMAIAEGTEGQIFIFFEKTKMQSRDWSSDGFIRQKTEELAKTGNHDSAEALKNHLLKNKLPLDPLTLVADILNTDMRTIASSDEKRVGVEEQEHAEGKSKEELMALKYGETMISQVMIEQESEIAGGVHPRYPVFHSLTPIKSSDNETTIGFLLLHFSADNLNKIMGGSFQTEIGALFDQEFILNQQTAEMFLVNKDGYMITSSRFIKDSVLKQKIDNPATRACFDEKKEYSGNYVGYLGREIQVASICLVNYDIVLLAEIGTDELFFPLKEKRNQALLVIGLIYLLSVLAIYWIVKLFLGNLMIIKKKALEIAKNNFNVKAEIKSKDEIGDLANAFNNMIDNIKTSQKQIKEADAKLKEINLSLEQKVKERTVELEKLKVGLEQNVAQKTVELHQKLAELEKFKKLTVGRELKMIELKQEIEELKKHA